LNIELQAALNPAGDSKVEWFGWASGCVPVRPSHGRSLVGLSHGGS